VAQVTGLDVSHVKVVDSSSVITPTLRSRRGNNRKGGLMTSHNVTVTVRITSSTDDFKETAVTYDTQSLFMKLTHDLSASVATGSFVSILRDASATHGAEVTKNVTQVTVANIDSEYTEVGVF
jgi:hypothetical protein